MARYSLEDIARIENELVNKLKKDKEYARKTLGDYIATWLPYTVRRLSETELKDKKRDIIDIGALVTGFATVIGDNITPSIVTVCCKTGYALVYKTWLRKKIIVDNIITYKEPRCSMCDDFRGSDAVTLILALAISDKYNEWSKFLQAMKECVSNILKRDKQ